MSEQKSGMTKAKKIIRLMGNAIMVIAIILILIMTAFHFFSPVARDPVMDIQKRNQVWGIKNDKN
jgi:flagellar biogenesis protein FliO